MLNRIAWKIASCCVYMISVVMTFELIRLTIEYSVRFISWLSEREDQGNDRV